MNKNFRTCIAWCAALTFALGAASADAAFHLYRISQIFSNADGTVQFIVLQNTGGSGENHWAGQFITSSGGGRFDFLEDLPSGQTGGTSVLIATQGFVNLHLIAPDYIVPNNFVSTGSGSINFADVHTVTYNAGQLPTDGIHALTTLGTVVTNFAVNFARETASVGSAPVSPNYQGLWWVPGGTENFWGINFAHQGDLVFGTWYTYDTSGNAYWLSMLGSRTTATSNVYSGDINVDVGPPFNGFIGSGSSSKVGTGTLTFSDASNGTFDYRLNAGTGGSPVAVNQTKVLARFDLGTGPQPTCTFSATANLAAATNYQDLWWAASGTEIGWGINFAHQANYIFATWYTYDAKGASNNPPMWLSALLQRQGTSNKFSSVQMSRTSGPRFDNYKASDVVQPIPTVGSATVTFTDGNSAMFNYTTNGNGGLPAGVNQTKAITRFPFGAGGTVCQ